MVRWCCCSEKAKEKETANDRLKKNNNNGEMLSSRCLLACLSVEQVREEKGKTGRRNNRQKVMNDKKRTGVTDKDNERWGEREKEREKLKK